MVNPYAPKLTFLDTQIRTRRDHEKYLTLIDTIALLHQYQRPVKVDEEGEEKMPYVEVELADVEAANRLAHEVLGRSLDELPPQTRRLLNLLDGMVSEACKAQGLDRSQVRFSARQVRESTGWGQTQVKVHLRRLVELEYLLVHRGERGNSIVYELVYDGAGEEEGRFLPGLIEVEALNSTGTTRDRSGSEGGRSGSNEERSGSGRPPDGPRSGGGRGGGSQTKPNGKSDFQRSEDEEPENAHLEPEETSSRSRSGSEQLSLLVARAAGGEG